MSGLIVTNTGLRFGTGLIWEKGLGGPVGLIIQPSGIQQGTIIFNGTGSLTVNAAQRFGSFIYFDGHGSLKVSTIQHGLSSVRFAGAGSLLALTIQHGLSTVRFNGAGGLSVIAGYVQHASAVFHALGALTVGPASAIQLEANFSGSQFESYFAFW